MLIALAAFVEGIAGQIFSVLWNTTGQMKVPQRLLSRVSAYDHLGSTILAPLGIVAAGFLFEVQHANDDCLNCFYSYLSCPYGKICAYDEE